MPRFSRVAVRVVIAGFVRARVAVVVALAAMRGSSEAVLASMAALQRSRLADQEARGAVLGL